MLRFHSTIHNCIIFAPPKTPILKSIGLIKYSLVFLICISSSDSFSQKLEMGAGAGLLQYKGDIQPKYNPFTGRPAGNAFVRYNLIPALSIKGQGLFGFIAGKDKRVIGAQHRARAYEFTSILMEYGGQIEYNFLDFRTSRSLRKSEGSPYLFVGYNSWTLMNRKNNLLSITQPTGSPTPILQYLPTSTESYSGNALVYGVGYKKVWKSNWNIGAEFGARKLKTDTFDTFGYQLLNTGILGPNRSVGGTTHPLLSKFNVPNTHLYDMYFYLNFSVSYVFYKVHCPNPR